MNQALILSEKKSTIKEFETHFHEEKLKKEEDKAYQTLLPKQNINQNEDSNMEKHDQPKS